MFVGRVRSRDAKECGSVVADVLARTGAAYSRSYGRLNWSRGGSDGELRSGRVQTVRALDAAMECGEQSSPKTKGAVEEEDDGVRKTPQ